MILRWHKNPLCKRSCELRMGNQKVPVETENYTPRNRRSRMRNKRISTLLVDRRLFKHVLPIKGHLRQCFAFSCGGGDFQWRSGVPTRRSHIPKMFNTSRRSSRLWNPSNVGVHESSLPGRLVEVINSRVLIEGPMKTHQYSGPNISFTSSSAFPRNPSSAIRFA